MRLNERLDDGAARGEVSLVKIKTVAFLSAALTFALVTSLGACSSSSSAGNAAGDSGAGDGATNTDSGVINDPANCVPPGTSGNALGIGGYCSPLGGQCDKAGPSGAARICTADLTSTPAHAWFCTFPCEHSSDCGSGNVCFQNSQGAGCIPNTCLYLDVDAGQVVPDDDGGIADAATTD